MKLDKEKNKQKHNNYPGLPDSRTPESLESFNHYTHRAR